MNDKKPDDYKVSWGSRRDIGEILMYVGLVLSVLYLIYAFFYPAKTENDNLDTESIEEIEKPAQASGGYRTKLDNLNLKPLSDSAAARL
jgi:hypothetical protein